MDAMEPAKAYADGPNTHHYRTFARGTTFYVITVDYPDGDSHTFHVPAEVVNQLESAGEDRSFPTSPIKGDRGDRHG